MTFIQANITLSTLPDFNLLVAIKGKLQIKYAVITFCDIKHREICLLLQIRPCLK